MQLIEGEVAVYESNFSGIALQNLLKRCLHPIAEGAVEVGELH
jgi:hypothetical protein